MTVLCLASFLFISSMLMNAVYAIMTGLGTVDRIKMKAGCQPEQSIEQPKTFKEIFGIAPEYWQWFLPVDPIFENYDHTLGFASRSRLLRERSNQFYYNGSVENNDLTLYENDTSLSTISASA